MVCDSQWVDIKVNEWSIIMITLVLEKTGVNKHGTIEVDTVCKTNKNNRKPGSCKL